MKGKVIFFVVLAILVVIGIAVASWFVGVRNQLVQLDEGVNEKWAQVENVYQRRADLIPNLVETVRGYAGHERETLEGVIEARAKASSVQLSPEMLSDPQAFQQFENAQGALSSWLSRLLVVVERYPDLKANENFRDLQVQLEGTENRITVERQRFNEVAREFNTKIRRFPETLVASMAGFSARPYFEAREGADEAPKVQF